MNYTNMMNLPIGANNTSTDGNMLTGTNATNQSKSTRITLGELCGKVVAASYRNWSKLVAIAVIIIIIVMVFNMIGSIADNQIDDNSMFGSAAHYALFLKHRSCKESGGCSIKCPYMQKDDPRAMMVKHINSINGDFLMVESSLQEEADSMDIALAKFQKPELRDAVKAKLVEYQIMKSGCLDRIKAFRSKALSLYQLYGNASTVTSDVIKANNRIAALEALVCIIKHVFVASIAQSCCYVIQNRLENLTKLEQDQIPTYDAKIFECKSHCNSMLELYNSIVSSYNKIGDAKLLDDTAGAQDIINAMADMFNLKKTTHIAVSTMTTKYNAVLDLFSNCFKDSFNNNLPNSMKTIDIDALIEKNDYNTVLLNTALEPEIISNHKKFASERATFDSGGGVPAVRDDDNDVVPWVGLFGRPTYRHSDGSSADTVKGSKSSSDSDPSRLALNSIPSDDPKSLMRTSVPSWSFR